MGWVVDLSGRDFSQSILQSTNVSLGLGKEGLWRVDETSLDETDLLPHLVQCRLKAVRAEMEVPYQLLSIVLISESGIKELGLESLARADR